VFGSDQRSALAGSALQSQGRPLSDPFLNWDKNSKPDPQCQQAAFPKQDPYWCWLPPPPPAAAAPAPRAPCLPPSRAWPYLFRLLLLILLLLLFLFIIIVSGVIII